ncbi:MAG: DegT/DnrJ/EryC1/StrS family aminotransferase [Magnetospirillum sp.]|nr:DegT/DnrJ/EryC1/StrS family aminotransferase [Magnetospirillum sp.]
MSTLAFFGGDKVRTEPFPAYRVMGEDEQRAAVAVIESGVLSRYLGTWHDDFWGGPRVREFEATWAEQMGCAHALAVNSATSGLYAAIGAAGVGPGDEVIVSPFTMVASATAPLIFNAVPVFADIDPRTYCLSPDSIRARISPRTKAIIVVHLFGQAADMDAIMDIANLHGLIVIEDCAQAPFATRHSRQTGRLGHMGVFSLNYHKHIHTGEGGIVTTDDADLANRVALIRNHAEAVVERMGVTNLVNMIGFNFRLGEIEAAIGLIQLAKGPTLVKQRQANIRYLERKLAGLPGLGLPPVDVGNEHVYYVHALDYDAAATGVPRELLVEALKAELPVTGLREAEGVLIGCGYTRPLYRHPLFRQQIAYGTRSCPFRCPHYEGTVNYAEGLCPNAERAHTRIITHELMRPPMSTTDLDDVAEAFIKVFSRLDALHDHWLRQ